MESIVCQILGNVVLWWILPIHRPSQRGVWYDADMWAVMFTEMARRLSEGRRVAPWECGSDEQEPPVFWEGGMFLNLERGARSFALSPLHVFALVLGCGDLGREMRGGALPGDVGIFGGQFWYDSQASLPHFLKIVLKSNMLLSNRPVSLPFLLFEIWPALMSRSSRNLSQVSPCFLSQISSLTNPLHI